MKIHVFILSATIATVAANAQIPLPPKSSISIKETPSEIPAPKPEPGSKCKLAHNLITYAPTVRLGADAQDGTVAWRFYAGVKNSEGRGLQLVSEQTLTPGTPVEIAPIVADASEWQCSCCRFLNKEFPKLLGWYSELEKDGKVIARAQSMGGSNDMTKLIAEKPAVPKGKRAYGLSFKVSSPEDNSPAPKTNPTPSPATTPKQPAPVESANAVTPDEVRATQAAIRKQADKVSYAIYKKVVPAYVTKSGELTQRGEAILGTASSEIPVGDVPSTTDLEVTALGASVKVERIGTGDKGIVIFGHTGFVEPTTDVSKFKTGLPAYEQLIKAGWSIFIFKYPRIITEMIKTAPRHEPDYSGFASEIIAGIQNQARIRKICVVGDSLGAGIVLWDYPSLSKNPNLNFVLVSPTPQFMPTKLPSAKLQRTVLVASEEGDPFYENGMPRFIKSNLHPYSKSLSERGHYIVGENLSHEELVTLIGLSVAL